MTDGRTYRHSWQSGRGRRALDPATAPIDGRSREDLLRMLFDIGGLLRFFTDADEENRDWGMVLDTDRTFLLAEIVNMLDAPFYTDTKTLASGELRSRSDTLLSELNKWHGRAQAHPRLSRMLDEVLRVDRSQSDAPETLTMLSLAETTDFKLSAEEQVLEYVSPLARTLRMLGEVARDQQDAVLGSESGHPAHIGLLLGFVEMLQVVQDHINRLTGAHLDFYYRRVLRLEPQGAGSDQVTVSLGLTADLGSLELTAGTPLEAGQTQAGEPIVYRTDTKLTLNHARVADLAVLALEEKPDGEDAWLRHVRCAHRQMPLTAPLAPFVADADHASAMLGLVVASPLLVLAGGKRDVRIRLRTSDDLGLMEKTLRKRGVSLSTPVGVAEIGLKILLSGADGPFSPHNATLVCEDRALVLAFRLSERAPGIVGAPAPDGVLGGAVLDINADAGHCGHAADFFDGIVITGIDIDVSVSDLLVDQVEGPEGPADTTQPFAPFGSQPRKNAAFSVTVPDLVGKQARDMQIVLDWSSLPGGSGFLDYYDGYAGSEEKPVANDSFKIGIDIRVNGTWRAADGDSPLRMLFDGTPSQLRRQTLLHIPGPRDATIQAARLRLVAPEMGFGLEVFPRVYAAAALKTARKRRNGGLKLPNPPFTPLLTAIRVSYCASGSLHAGSERGEGRFFSRLPMGYLGAPDGAIRIADLPRGDHRNRSTLYLGLADAAPGIELNLWIRMDTDTTRIQSADALPLAQRLDWRYLSESGWVSLPPGALVHDGTDGLSHGGIVRLRLPLDASANRTEMPTGRYWVSVSLAPHRATGVRTGSIQATVDPDPRTFGPINAILPRAVVATRERAESQPWSNALPGTITHVMDNAAAGAVPEVAQPEPGTGGVAAETENEFRIRVSERLRHKNRAIQPRDYEQVTLAEFPDIGDAKLIRRGPGKLTLVVAGRRGSDGPLPTVGPHRLRAIARTLRDVMPAAAIRFSVRAARFEPVRARAWLEIEGDAPVDILRAVEEATDAWIAPWLSDLDAACPIGTGELDPLALEARLTALKGIRRLTGLSLMRTGRHAGPEEGRPDPFYDIQSSAPELRIEHTTTESQSALIPSGPESVLVPSGGHLFHPLRLPTEIGSMRIDTNLIVGPGKKVTHIPRKPPETVDVRSIPIGIGELRIGEEFSIGATDEIDLSDLAQSD